MQNEPRVIAVLGPTNTGKTHYAIERMLGHRTGIIGLPLRLLAREVYDRIVKLRGPSVVALVTGEERIVPDRVQYWVCTVEAMPEGMGVDFLAVDEIQLCADPERGHVFTDRLLHARGLHETLLLGSETMHGAIAALVPGVVWARRDRFSTLTYSGSKKISRMPERAAIVGFSVENVYAIAEFIRRTRGGAAVVMGALSPRTRNAQVQMYQNGEVDFLVATDAIGMGLNLDITHVAFSSLTKFDGSRMRALQPDELAQIAGRAGRHLTPGTFGVTGEAPDLDPDVVEAIENHRFSPVTRLKWRNGRLQFGSLPRLIQTLEERTENPWLTRVRESDDLAALKTLAADADVAARASDGPSVRLLWDVCRIPDFRGISKAEHAAMLGTIFKDLHQSGHVPMDWFADQVRRIDRTDGDIDTLSKRLAFVRTWTYVAQRNNWVPDEKHWRAETRAVEDRLSDALHASLTARFVDRRTSVLARRLRQKEVLVAEVNDKGDVTVEGEFVGRLEGFRFRPDKAATAEEGRTLRQAAAQALLPHLSLRADRFYNAPDTEIDFTEQGGLMWGEHAVGKLVRGPEPLKPGVQSFVDDDAGEDVAQKVTRRLQHFIDRKLAATMEPLLALQRDATLVGLAKGFAFRLVENLGIIPRSDVAEDVKALDQESRSALRKQGVRFGQFTVFLPPLLKPAPTRLRLVLWGLAKGLPEFPGSPPAGHVTVIAAQEAQAGYYAMAGYRAAGDRAIRIDMLERLADLLRDRDSKAGFEAVPEMLSITGLSMELFAGLMTGLGYRAEKAERVKVKAAKPQAPAAVVVAKPADPVADDIRISVQPSDPDSEIAADTQAVIPAEEEVLSDSAAVTAPVLAEAGPAGDIKIDTQPFEPEGEVAADTQAVIPAPEISPVAAADTAPALAETSPPVVADAAAEGVADLAQAGPAATPPQPAAPVEMESFYTFTWGGRANRGEQRDRPQGQPRGERREGQRGDRRPGGPRRDQATDAAAAIPAAPVADAVATPDAAAAQPRRERRPDNRPDNRPDRKRDGDAPRVEGKPRGEGRGEHRDRGERGAKPARDGKPERRNEPQVFEARPPREDKRKIDPDSPFAALAALKFK